MPGKFPVGKPKLPSGSLPLIAVFFALLVHALWLIVPQPRPAPASRPVTARLFAYPNLDSRTWSPTLFSLPSALGFSGAIQQKASNVQPPLQSPVQLIRMERLEMGDLFPEPGIQEEFDLRSNLPVTVYLDPGPDQESSRAYAWNLQVLEGPDVQLELSRLPPASPGGGTRIVTGIMTFDEGGQLSSLILDPVSLPAEQRTDLLRSLRRVRIAAKGSESRIRFRFGYVPVEERQ